MIISKKLLKHLEFIRKNPNYVDGLSRYKLLEELEAFGVTISFNCDLDRECLRRIYKCVILRMIEKYKL